MKRREVDGALARHRGREGLPRMSEILGNHAAGSDQPLEGVRKGFSVALQHPLTLLEKIRRREEKVTFLRGLRKGMENAGLGPQG